MVNGTKLGRSTMRLENIVRIETASDLSTTDRNFKEYVTMYPLLSSSWPVQQNAGGLYLS